MINAHTAAPVVQCSRLTVPLFNRRRSLRGFAGLLAFSMLTLGIPRLAAQTSTDSSSVSSNDTGSTSNGSSSIPTITQQPKSTTVNVGSTVTLSVIATGSGDLNYQWRKDGVAVADGTDATLTIEEATQSDAGTYDVVISSGNLSVTSSGATLTVSTANAAPSITEQPENAEAQVGGTATLSVSATGTPAPAYQWRKDGTAISGDTAAKLVISNVQTTDAGSYDVVVSNSVGSVTSRLVRLDVATSEQAPTIDSQPESLGVIVGQPAKFSVEAESDPAPTYQWTKGGNAIAGATSATFTIAAAQLSDAGTYSVVVSNASGTVTSRNATLSVYANDYAGSYFGTIGTNGQFALTVDHDHTASFLGTLGDGKTAIVKSDIKVDDSGNFAFEAATTTVSASDASTGGLKPATATTSLSVAGTISSSGQLTGTITGATTLTMSGTKAASGVTADSEGFYQTASSSSDDTVSMLVGGDGRALVLTQTPTGVSATTGTVDSSGKVTATLPNGDSVDADVAATSGSAKATLTDPSGSTSLSGGNTDLLESQHLVGISARALCDTGSNNSVAGFIINGTVAQHVLIRAVGPGLSSQGITQPIPNPKLDLYEGQTLIASNTGWSTASNASEIAAAAARIGDFELSTNSTDSAIFTTLQPGLYTANASPSDGKPGVVLVEVYNLSTPSLGNKIVALSGRVEVGTGQDNGVAGFVVSGTVPKKFLIRAVGPTLAAYNVSDYLTHPGLKLYKGSTLVAQNTGWTTAANATDIPAASTAVGEFALQSNDDSALLVTLDPGVYTANVSSGDSTKGVALIEVYEIR